MDKVHKTITTQYYTPPSKPFRILMHSCNISVTVLSISSSNFCVTWRRCQLLSIYSVGHEAMHIEGHFLYGSTVPRVPGTLPCQRVEITLRHITLGRAPLDERSVERRDLYLTILTTDRHPYPSPPPPGGIRNRSPSKRVAADARLRPRGHWHRRQGSTRRKNILSTTNPTQNDLGSYQVPRGEKSASNRLRHGTTRLFFALYRHI
jgi:hypothetical protein